MKPLKLEIEGIKSFKEKVEIDFKTLIDRGLFGIFGSTGSGKSTILYCINLALYYNTAFKNFINSKCDKASVSLYFELNIDGELKEFLVTREFKTQGNSQGFLYEILGDKKICIQEKTTDVTNKIIELVGLNLDEFKKCIALPQGEFSSFIQSTNGAKTDIIARLFSLQDYSEKITKKAKERKDILNTDFLNLQSRLSEYEDTNKEVIDLLDKKIIDLSLQLKIIKQLQISKSEKYETDKKTYEINKEFNKVKEIYSNLISKKESIELKKSKLEKAEKYASILSSNSSNLP